MLMWVILLPKAWAGENDHIVSVRDSNHRGFIIHKSEPR
jgi:hypothetical protein